jgi:imidazolonepropionase-like amidohydrolase
MNARSVRAPRAAARRPALWLGALAALSAGAGARAQDLLVQCKTLVVAPDTIVTPGELLVRDGKVAHVGPEIPAEARARARTITFADATIVPAFVLAHSTLGRDGDLVERSEAMTPALHAADAFDPFGDDLKRLARLGIGSCALAPGSGNVAGGIAALVKPGAAMGTVAREASYSKLVLAAPARNPERQPTALMGAIDLLRQSLRAARADQKGDPALQALASVLRGERRAFVHADTRAEIMAVLALAKEFGIEPVLLGAGDATDLVEPIAQARAAVALWPLQPAMRDEQLRLPQALATRGVPFCFVGEPGELRTAAALAVRYGTSRRAALAAITRTPAEFCGAADAVGSLRRGCDADFTVFRGDPLDLGSRLLAVYVGGVQLFGDAPKAPPGPPDASRKDSL